MAPRNQWTRLLDVQRDLHRYFPDLVLVGGTASALHANHRVSLDADHVLADLRSRFDEVLSELEGLASWQTARVRRPVLILGKLDGVETGIRQLMRTRPLETQVIEGIRVPTPGEMLRIKAWLVVTRNKTRDYLDTAALADQLGRPDAVAALGSMDELYPQDSGESVLRQLAKQLAEPLPDDLDDVDLTKYRELKAPWTSWDYVKDSCLSLSDAIVDSFLG